MDHRCATEASIHVEGQKPIVQRLRRLEVCANQGVVSLRPRHGLAAHNQQSHLVTGKQGVKMLGTILIVVLLLALFGALPRWPHSRHWGYYPSGGLGTVLLIVVILILLGRI